MVNNFNRRKWNQAVKQSIADDERLRNFLLPYFNEDLLLLNNFINKCAKKIITHRMLLRLYWYGDLASLVNDMKPGRPAIPLIFLLALAEGLEKIAQNKEQDDSNSLGYINTFFRSIIEKDKDLLKERFKRLFLRPRYNLSFRSMIKILWNVRCDAAHGREYWNFLLSDKAMVLQGVGHITSGKLGKRNKKIRTSLEVSLTFEELFGIFIRTGIRRIENEL